MKLIIDIPDYNLNDIQNGSIACGQILKAVKNGKPYEERPQGEYEFIEVLAQDVPDDICTYPEYRGKPYYSIHYKENGEEFVGFGTYNPKVLSRYLRDYFIKGDTE